MQGKRGLELGRPFGFPLLVHRSWLGAAPLLVALLALTAFGPYSLLVAIASSVGVAAGVFISLVIHEGAHGLVRRLTGAGTIDSTLFVFGGIARTNDDTRRPLEEAIVAVVGPITNAALAFAAFAAGPMVTGAVGEIVRTIGRANLALAAINVLPGLPLDAGRILVGALWARGRAKSEAVRLASRVGEALGLGISMTGVWLTATNFAAVPDAGLGLFLVVVGVFVISEARRARRAALVAAIVADGTAGSWARPFTGKLRSTTPVPDDGGPYAVSDGNRLAGVLMPAALGVAHGRRAGDVMIPWTQEIALPADTPMTAVLQRLAVSRSGVLVVLDAGGVVRGVIDADGVKARLGAS